MKKRRAYKNKIYCKKAQKINNKTKLAALRIKILAKVMSRIKPKSNSKIKAIKRVNNKIKVGKAIKYNRKIS
jgi:hypothetical protein